MSCILIWRCADMAATCAGLRPQLAASVYSPLSGRAMDLSTNTPGLQFYAGNNLNGSLAGKGAYLYPQHGGFAMESQVRAPVFTPNPVGRPSPLH